VSLCKSSLKQSALSPANTDSANEESGSDRKNGTRPPPALKTIAV
jgi:hypothetical protein